MKKKLFAAFAVAVMSVMMVANVAFAGALDFYIINFSGYPIHSVTLKNETMESWSGNILQEVLPEQGAIQIGIPVETPDTWDLRVGFEDGSELEWTAINLRTTTRITIASGTAVFE